MITYNVSSMKAVIQTQQIDRKQDFTKNPAGTLVICYKINGNRVLSNLAPPLP